MSLKKPESLYDYIIYGMIIGLLVIGYHVITTVMDSVFNTS